MKLHSGVCAMRPYAILKVQYVLVNSEQYVTNLTNLNI